MRRAGRRDRLITIQTDSGSSVDAIGNPVESWGTHTQPWAEYIPVSGREVFESGREVIRESARFIIDYDSSITANGYRISYNSKTWDIVYIRELGREEALEILAEVRT